jgi:hypothetical protein
MANKLCDLYTETRVLSKYLHIPGLVELVKDYTKFQCMGLQCTNIGTRRTIYVQGIKDMYMTINRTVLCENCHYEWMVSKRQNSPCLITCNQEINIEYMRYFNIEQPHTTPLTYTNAYIEYHF